MQNIETTKPEEIIKEQPKVAVLDKLKIHKFKILGGVLGILVFVGAVFSAYKLGQLSLSKAPALKIDCQQDSDCVLVVDTKSCCSCPTAVNKSELSRNKDLMIYLPEEMGEAQEMRPECEDVICAPCAFWNKTICESGRCKGIYEEESSGYQIFGSLAKDASEEDSRLLRETISQYATSISILESFPMQFQIITPDKESCEEIRRILPRFEFISSFEECRLKETPLYPEEPVEKEEEVVGEKIVCQEPRPQVCTMECIVSPPYICGSDGKSYCSTCQACANPSVGWYVLQNTLCGAE